MDEQRTATATTPRPPQKNLKARCFYGAGCGACSGMFVAILAMSLPSPLPSGPNSMVAMFAGPAILVVLLMTVTFSTVMGIVGAACRSGLVIFIGAIVVCIMAMFFNGEPIVRDLAPYAFSGVIIATLAGWGVRRCVGVS